MTLTPIIARLQITKVSFLTDGSTPFSREINNVLETATVSWTGFSADLKGIYFNNFYNTYNNPGTFSDLLSNNTFQGNIQLGQWLFTNPSLNAAEFASYSNYTGGAYQNLPLETANKCYAFNFFPGTAMPMIHLDLANLQITDIQSTDNAVFNPSLFPSERFANIVKFYKNVNTPMTAADFVAGKLYNMEIVVMPILDNDLGNIQYNILVKVTIAPWSEETIIPGFDLEQ